MSMDKVNNEIIDSLARKLSMAEANLALLVKFPDREEPPTAPTKREDALPFVVWQNDPYFLGDTFCWKAQAAFRHAQECLEHISRLQERTQTCILQSPDGCRTITPDMPRVWGKPVVRAGNKSVSVDLGGES